jgi:hypothetical protein
MKASVDHVGSNSTYSSVHRSLKEFTTEQIYLCCMVFGENICHTHHLWGKKISPSMQNLQPLTN